MSLSVFPLFEGEWQYTHTNKIAPMYPFKADGKHCLNSLQIGSFSSPISTTSRAIFLATDNNQLFALCLILFSRIKNVAFFACWDMNGLWSSLSFKHFVDDSNVSKSTTGHDQIVATTRSVCVEVGATDTT